MSLPTEPAFQKENTNSYIMMSYRTGFQFLNNDFKKREHTKLVRVTPNIRIKYGRELSDNENRGLNTQLPHSDAWVEGPGV